MTKKNHTNLHLLISIFFLFPFCSWVSLALAQSETIIPVNVGVVLDDLKYSLTKDIWLRCMKMALGDFYATHAHYNTRLVLNTRHCRESVVSAAAAALDLIKNERVKAIIGPVTSMQTSFVINLGNQAHVPIISFSATSPSLTSLRIPYFFQFAQTDSSQVEAISAIVKAFGWRQVVPIYINTEYGQGIIPYLTDALQEVDARVPYRSVISSSATDGQIVQELSKLMSMETRVFIVHMTADLSSRLFVKAKEVGMMSEGYVWLTTNEILNRLQSQNFTVINSMQGVLGIQTFVPLTPELEDLKIGLKRQFHTENPAIGAELDVFGLWAYDAVFAVAMAIEQAIGTPTGFPFQGSIVTSNHSTDGFPVSPYGPELCRALATARFQGIAGNFSVVGRQRESSNFRVVNVNGGEATTIGFWTLKEGLVKTLNSSANSSKPSSSKFKFGPIRWPGNCPSVPKGWEFPTNGKKLRIGVPVKQDFTEYVKVTINHSTNTTDVTGFSVDVFKAAVVLLPYALPYEFIPFAYSNGTSAGTYNQLCHQVYLKKFDAVVGDTTIRADRSLYVDFTMPYSESGVSMVVPVIDFKSKQALAFLKPWTWDLWLTTCFFFVYIGFVIWVLEHRINKEFRGPLSHQVGTSIWFSCSTMVFAHRERVLSNLARFVMIIWVFVVLILTINYTASLSSLYTFEQLQPTVDIEDLLRNHDNVGYIKNSYVYDLLKQVGFDDSKLKEYETMEEIDEALSKGTAKDGIAAVVHGTPKMKLFLAKYCSKYTMIEPIFKTDGFAFVFAKRSPLVDDVSQAILNMTGGDKIMTLEKEWLKNESSCSDSSGANVSSNSLGLGSFWVLFLVAGLASILALIIFVAFFIHRHRDKLVQPADSEPSTWRKIQALVKIFNEKDLDSHTFRRSGKVRDAVMNSPNNFPGTVVHHSSDHTDQTNSSVVGEQQTTSIFEAPSDVLLPSTTEVDITVQEMHGTTSNTTQEYN
ncbi:putative periplasmic binding protein-like I [Rosa chinensis]|uniref:Glutamate receptor n=1 Tax=Rosa chinensis TaxID=74649 RepID=A0A2P6PZL9_ROSCH|nr:putative periplasmic binding protein-like I [Rosa chinensis]